MNQKEYEIIANIFYLSMIQLNTVGEADLWHKMVNLMADTLEMNFPTTFHRTKFLKACGL